MEPIRILVIDDEPVICDGCRLPLSDRGFVVDTCQSGTKGLEMLLGGEYDLALLDMKLPDINGMEILRQTRKTRCICHYHDRLSAGGRCGLFRCVRG
jgi:two-component system NtrC family response regulator